MYLVYKITNTINNKIYIGTHKTDNIFDKYMGSGKILKQAQKKYGIENFKKEILEVFDNEKDMFWYEKKMVTQKFINHPNTYNVNIGGYGGWTYVNQNKLNCHSKTFKYCSENRLLGTKAIQKLLKNKNFNDFFRKRVSEGLKKYFENGGTPSFKNKKHKPETIEKFKGHTRQQGSKNSQYGKIWIYNNELKKSKIIPKNELKQHLSANWIRGRKLKF